MLFSSDPVFQVLDPPDWNHQPPGGSESDNNNFDDRNHQHLITLPPIPPSQGLSTGPNSMAERPRLTKLLQQETGHKCPRCTSTNTKFCYYNNYSLSQPRHFCKACRRYWTRGGALRNVPVGGGFRRNKRSKISIRSKSPVNGNSSTSGVSSSSCTTNNILGHAAPSILPHFPLFPLINFTTDLGAEDMNILPFRGIQSPTITPGEYSDQWRLQKLPVAAGLEPPSAEVMYQFRSEGLGEATSQYGFKTVDSCGPSQIELIKFEEDQGFISLEKNFLRFSGNEQQEYWSPVNAWNEPNALNPSTGHLL